MPEGNVYTGLCAGGPMDGKVVEKYSKSFGVAVCVTQYAIPEVFKYTYNEPSRMFIWQGPEIKNASREEPKP